MKAKVVSALTGNRLLGVGWAVVLAYLLILAVDSFVTDCTGDSCIYIYVAKGILQGEIPYLDRWDNKGPLFYTLISVGLVIHEAWGVLLMQGLFLLGTTLFAFALLRKSFGFLPAFFALAVFLTYYSRFALPGNFTEQYGLLFQFLTLYLFIHSDEQGKPKSSRIHFPLLHIGIGVLGAASFLHKPNTVALWVVIGIYWLFIRRNSIGKLAWAVVGGGGVLILVAWLFLVLGAWGALWDAVFLYNFAHISASLSERLRVILNVFTEMLPISLLVIVAWSTGVLLFVRKRLQVDSFGGLLAISLVLLPFEVVSLSLSGFEYRHNYLPALPVITLLLAYLVRYISLKRNVAYWLLSAVLLAGSTYNASPHANLPRLAEKYTQKGASVIKNESPIAVRIRDLIQNSTHPNDRILVWGKGAWIHLISNRDAPTRFFQDVPLTKPHYTSQAIRDEFFSDVRETVPKLIIDMRASRMPPLRPAERQSWRSTGRYRHDPEDFQPFFDFVEENYLAVDTLPPYTVFSLKRDDAANQVPIQGELIIRSVYDVYLDGRTLNYVRRQCANDDAAKRFILHVIPVDNSVIDGNEQHTMDFSFIEGKEWYVGESCVVSRQLPDFAIAYIRTGQYDISRSRHEWLSEFHFSESK